MSEISTHERKIEEDPHNTSYQSSPETLSCNTLGSQLKHATLNKLDGAPYRLASEHQSLEPNISNQPARSVTASNSENLSIVPKSEVVRQQNHPRVIIDQSVVVALLDHGYTDDKFNNYGYLGGKRVLTSHHSDETICHISHFIPSIRSIESMLAGKAEESSIALKLALEAFSTMGVELLGWYRSDTFHKTLKPTQSDLLHQSRLQKAIPYGVGVLVSGCKSPKSIDALHSGIPYELTMFRLSSPSMSLHKESDSKQNSDDAASYNSIPVIFGVNQQPYTNPELIRQIAGTLKAILVESHVLFEAQRVDCGQMAGRKLFTDSEYDGFLMRFWKTSAIQLKKTVEQEFHSLALKKHHLKSLLAQKISHLQSQIELDYKTTSSDIREMKLAALEKLIDQTLNEQFKKHPSTGSFNINTWINIDTKVNQVSDEEHELNFKRKSESTVSGLKRQRKSGHSKCSLNRRIDYLPLESPFNGHTRSSNQPQFSGKTNSSPHSQSGMIPTQQSHHDFVSFSHPPTPISVEVSPARVYEQQHNAAPPNLDNPQVFLPPASQLPIASITSNASINATSSTIHSNIDLASSDSTSVSLPSIHGLFEMAATESITMDELNSCSNDPIISPMQGVNMMDPLLSKTGTKNEQSDKSMVKTEADTHLAYRNNRVDNDHESLTSFSAKTVDAHVEVVTSHSSDTVTPRDIPPDNTPLEREESILTEPKQSLDEFGNLNSHA